MRTGAIVLLLISATASLAAPNIVVIMTDDQDDTGSMAYMPKTLSLIAEHGKRWAFALCGSSAQPLLAKAGPLEPALCAPAAVQEADLAKAVYVEQIVTTLFGDRLVNIADRQVEGVP